MTSPLLQAVHQSCGEALALATHFATSSDLPPASLLKQRAADLLDRMAATASKAGLCAEDIGDIQYALVAFMDEQILKSPWDGKQDWMVEPLQLVYFNETTAGEGFFTRLREIETRPERAHVLLAYYLCLVLGFQGVYAIRDHRAVDEHLASVAARLSTLLPELDSISPHGIPSDSGRQRATKKLPIIAMALVLVSLAVVCYLGLRIAVGVSASNAATNMNEAAAEVRAKANSEGGR